MLGARNRGRIAAVAVSALFAPLVDGAAPVVSADPDVPAGCVVLAMATKRFEGLNDKVKALNVAGASSEQVRSNTREQVGLWRQMRDLLEETATGIGDAPELADAARENGEAIGEYADLMEELVPHSKENPPSGELKSRYDRSVRRKDAAGAAMADIARGVCAKQ